MDEELITQVLEKYFSDFKEYHLLILVGFTLIVALILIIQSIWVSRELERFRSVLKKSEIKYSTYNQLQIESLSKIYHLLSDFSEQTFIVGQEIGSGSPEGLTKTAKNWLILYKNVYIAFSREKYILPKNIKEKYALIFSKLENMKEYIKSEKDMSAMFYTWETGEVEFMGDDMVRSKLFDNLKKYKKDGIINKTIDNTTELRKEIEHYFENIE